MGDLHELRGPTLEATYLNVSQFLENCKHDRGKLLEFVSARNNENWDIFDQSIRLIIVDRAQLSEELEEILFENDESVIKRAVKCKWFFVSAPTAYFTTSLLPVVSMATRLKVINALGRWRGVSGDVVLLFEWVRRHYGLHTAEPLLPNCPKEYISNIVLSDIRAVSNTTFLAIARRLPELAEKMAGHWLDLKRQVPRAVSKLLFKQPELLIKWDIDRLIKLRIAIGRKLLPRWRLQIEQLPNIKKLKILSKDGQLRLFRGLSYAARVEFLALVVKGVGDRVTLADWENALSAFTDFLRPFPPLERDHYLHDTFKSVFYLDLWSSREACVPLLLELTSTQRRADVLNSLKLGDEDAYLYLKPPTESIPLLIDKIKRCPEASGRCTLVKSMVASCRVTLDPECLQQVLEYVHEAHAHQPVVLKLFLEATLSSSYLRTKLPLSSSRQLVSIASKVIDKWQSNKKYLFAHEIYLTKCIEAQESTKSAADMWLRDFTKFCAKHCYQNLILVQFSKAPQARLVFNVLYDQLPEIIEEVASQYDKNLTENITFGFVSSFLLTMKEIGIFVEDISDAGEMIFKLLDKCKDDYNHNLPASAVWRTNVAYHYNGSGFWRVFTCHPNCVDLFRIKATFLFRNLINLINELVKCSNQVICHFLKSRRILNFYSLDKIIKLTCVKNIAKNDVNKSKWLFIYSLLASVEDFKEIAHEYLGPISCIDTSRKDLQLLYDVPSYIRNLRPYRDLFSLVRGKLISSNELFFPHLRAFHKACYNVPVNQAFQEVFPLLDAPVSVMKKAVAILTHICDKKKAITLLRERLRISKHYSIITALFRHFIAFFNDDPSNEVWDVVAEIITNGDEALLPFLPSVSLLPVAFVQSYTETVFKFLYNLPNKYEVQMAKIEFFHDLACRVSLLNCKICEEIIGLTFFTPDSHVNPFTVRYLSDCCAPIEQKLNLIEGIFRDKAQANPSHFHHFAMAIISEDIAYTLKFLPTFLRFFEKYLQRAELFEAYQSLLYLDLKRQAVKNGVVDLSLLPAVGIAIRTLWLTVADRDFLHPILTTALKRVFPKNSELIAVISGLVDDSVVDPIVSIIVLQAIPHDWDSIRDKTKIDSAKNIDTFIANIRNSTDPALQLYYKEYLAAQNNFVLNFKA